MMRTALAQKSAMAPSPRTMPLQCGRGRKEPSQETQPWEPVREMHLRGNLEHSERSSASKGCEKSSRSARSDETKDTL